MKAKTMLELTDITNKVRDFLSTSANDPIVTPKAMRRNRDRAYELLHEAEDDKAPAKELKLFDAAAHAAGLAARASDVLVNDRPYGHDSVRYTLSWEDADKRLSNFDKLKHEIMVTDHA